MRRFKERKNILSGVQPPLVGVLPRDLRRTVATYLAQGKVTRFDVRRVLNHKDQEVTSDYDQYAYAEEKRTALNLWDTLLTEILSR